MSCALSTITKPLLHSAAATPYNLWCYTGYTWDEITSHPELLKVAQLCDAVVEGRFVLTQRDTSLRFRGSHNQRIIDVTQSLAAHSPITLTP